MLYNFRVIWRWIIVTLKSGYKSLKIIQSGTIRKLECGFLFAFHSNYGYMLHHFWDKARYWSKIVIFSYPVYSTPPLGGPRRNISIPFGMEKLECWGYPTVQKIEDMCNRFDRIPACDRQTDRRTDILRRHSPRYACKLTAEYASLMPNAWDLIGQPTCTPLISGHIIKSNPIGWIFWKIGLWICFTGHTRRLLVYRRYMLFRWMHVWMLMYVCIFCFGLFFVSFGVRICLFHLSEPIGSSGSPPLHCWIVFIFIV